jgi:hypothetical protein
MGARTTIRIVSAAMIVAVLSACHVALRANDDDPIACTMEGMPCGPGSSDYPRSGPKNRTCRGGLCLPCTPKHPDEKEDCNGLDDNCNGLVDEGLDQDGDGFTECSERPDCNDDPAKGGAQIHPDAEELCDGIDNNCNGQTDENTVDCAKQGLVCWTAERQCVATDDCRLPTACPRGTACNPETGKCTGTDCRITPCPVGRECVEGACREITEYGAPCDGTSLCKGSSCIDVSAIGVVVGASPRICTQGCCDSSGCPSGFVCRGGPGGASVCVRGADVGVTPGSVLAFGPCTASEECRSGVCGPNGVCVDGCCGSQTCGQGGTCAFQSSAFICGARAGNTDAMGNCFENGACATGRCLDVGFLSPGRCIKRCCNGFDCPGGTRCEVANAGGGRFVQICRSSGRTLGGKRGGEVCAAAGECRSGECTDGRCVDICCRDADCAAGTVCRPGAVSGGGTPLQCQLPR